MKTSIRCMSVSELESVSSRVERTGMIKLCLIQRTNHIFCPSLSFKIIVYELMFMSIKLCLPPHSFLWTRPCPSPRSHNSSITFKVSHSTSEAQTLFVWRKVMDLIQDRLISLCMIFQKCHRNAKKGFLI